MRRKDIEKLNKLNETVKKKRALIEKIRTLHMRIKVGPIGLEITERQAGAIQSMLAFDLTCEVNDLDAEIYRVMEVTDETD